MSGYVTNVAISPDGRRAATVGGNVDTANVWDIETGRRVATMVGHSGNVENIAFSPDGTLLATGSHDGTARIWDAETGQEILQLAGARAALGEVKFSPDGRWLATGAYDGVVRIWDITPGGSREALTIGVNGPFPNVPTARMGRCSWGKTTGASTCGRPTRARCSKPSRGARKSQSSSPTRIA